MHGKSMFFRPRLSEIVFVIPYDHTQLTAYRILGRRSFSLRNLKTCYSVSKLPTGLLKSPIAFEFSFSVYELCFPLWSVFKSFYLSLWEHMLTYLAAGVLHSSCAGMWYIDPEALCLSFLKFLLKWHLWQTLPPFPSFSLGIPFSRMLGLVDRPFNFSFSPIFKMPLYFCSSS